MQNRYTTQGFQLLSVAAAGFLVAGIIYRLEPATILGFALTAAGFFLAASARSEDNYHWGRVGLGLSVAYVGMMPFFFEAFFPLQATDWHFIAVLGFLAGLLAITAGAFLAMRFGNDLAARILTRGGAVSITLAGLVWLPFHIAGGNFWWTPGNLAIFAGGLLLLVGLIRMETLATSAQVPSKA